MAHLDEYKLLSDRQHAFRKSETQLTTVINDWAKILDNGGQVVNGAKSDWASVSSGCPLSLVVFVVQ